MVRMAARAANRTIGSGDHLQADRAFASIFRAAARPSHAIRHLAPWDHFTPSAAVKEHLDPGGHERFHVCPMPVVSAEHLDALALLGR